MACLPSCWARPHDRNRTRRIAGTSGPTVVQTFAPDRRFGGVVMTSALTAALLWLVVANVIAMLPSRDHHWRAAYVLIAIGIPLLGWVTVQSGPIWGMLILAAGASVLRWPLIHLWRWAKGKTGPSAE